jgi:hypothetical protein
MGMQRITSIFFLIIFATTYTDLGQLVKLPILVQHYFSHNQKNPVSFFNYLQEHYTNHGDDGDNKEDMQLPFKLAAPTPSLVASLPSAGQENIETIPVNQDTKFFPPISFVASMQVFSIFHPPRTVC